MLSKAVFHTSFDYGVPPNQIIYVPRHGRAHTKYAAVSDIFNKEIAELRPDPKRTVLHIIALGDEEYYGHNRNGDAFSKEDTVTAHKTFKELGHVFRNHKNTDPTLAVGEVLATAHNDTMGRVELLIALDNEKCEKEIEHIENGELIPFSMGSAQEYDVCSVCGHKAEIAEDHCEHIKTMLCQVLDDGRVVYMKNPNPKFFDISIVYRPADRIAYSLRKVASAGAISGYELAMIFDLTHTNASSIKYAAKSSLKDLEQFIKHVPILAKGEIVTRKVCDPDVKRALKTAATIYGPGAVLCCLNENCMLMPFSDFSEILFDYPIGYEPVLPISALFAEPDADRYIDTFHDCGCGCDAIPANIIDALKQAYQINPNVVAKRVMIIALRPEQGFEHDKRVIVKNAMSLPSEHEGLAKLYGYYKLAFVKAHMFKRPDVAKLVSSTFVY